MSGPHREMTPREPDKPKTFADELREQADAIFNSRVDAQVTAIRERCSQAAKSGYKVLSDIKVEMDLADEVVDQLRRSGISVSRRNAVSHVTLECVWSFGSTPPASDTNPGARLPVAKATSTAAPDWPGAVLGLFGTIVCMVMVGVVANNDGPVAMAALAGLSACVNVGYCVNSLRRNRRVG